MLFYRNLDKIIFTRDQLVSCDELVIISGYVGPNPIRDLATLPIKSTVIYGMYGSDGIQQSLHNALVDANKTLDKVDILYSTIPVHAKCYIWKYKGEVRSALVGSANFSVNGLTTPFKEVLADATVDTFDPLAQYIDLVLDKAISCEEAVVSKNKRKRHNPNEDLNPTVYDRDVCSMPLFIMEDGVPTVPPQSGINWGLAKLSGSHVNINDAYIRIGGDLLEHYPELFPQKQEAPSEDQQVGRAGHRHNDNIEILWDDGTSMTGLLEGSVPKNFNGKREIYPKQISSSPRKAELGKYLRHRMGIKEGHRITYDDLKAYGRTTIDVSLQGDGIYYFDFSVQNTDTQERIITYSNEIKKQPAKVAESTEKYTATNQKQGTSDIKVRKGDSVIHKTYGKGVVSKIEGSKLLVNFNGENKQFQYPSSFEKGFLKLES